LLVVVDIMRLVLWVVSMRHSPTPHHQVVKLWQIQPLKDTSQGAGQRRS
jgi:hypothetical protein